MIKCTYHEYDKDFELLHSSSCMTEMGTWIANKGHTVRTHNACVYANMSGSITVEKAQQESNSRYNISTSSCEARMDEITDIPGGPVLIKGIQF